MNHHYRIKFAGLTYHVEPFFDEDQLFATIHRVDGLEQYGPDELPAMFDQDVHTELAKMLGQIMRADAEEV